MALVRGGLTFWMFELCFNLSFFENFDIYFSFLLRLDGPFMVGFINKVVPSI